MTDPLEPTDKEFYSIQKIVYETPEGYVRGLYRRYGPICVIASMKAYDKIVEVFQELESARETIKFLESNSDLAPAVEDHPKGGLPWGISSDGVIYQTKRDFDDRNRGGVTMDDLPPAVANFQNGFPRIVSGHVLVTMDEYDELLSLRSGGPL